MNILFMNSKILYKLHFNYDLFIVWTKMRVFVIEFVSYKLKLNLEA